MKQENRLYHNKTRRKFDLVKTLNLSELDFSKYIDKIKTEALMYSDYQLAADIRLWEIKRNK